jgi:predicted acyltransferase
VPYFYSYLFRFMSQRNNHLDALRGYAILTMILSGAIAHGGVLPAWMYHAQVPPPLHIFNPDLPGITWVDLVFPFFLFSMGAAIPLALQKQIATNARLTDIIWIALRRYILLAFFAIFFQHLKPLVQSTAPSYKEYGIALFGFALLFFQFYSPVQQKEKQFNWLQKIAFAIGLLILYILPFADGGGFKLNRCDIIILVLANMAFFGTIIWWCTKNKPIWRLAALPIIMAVFLGSTYEGSISQVIFQATPAPWLYKFYYLKYLFIIVPATFAGEWMLQKEVKDNKASSSLVSLLSLTIIVVNVCLLFTRQLQLNFTVSVVLLLLFYFLFNKKAMHIEKKYFTAAAYLLILGLLFEAFEGGIKKDKSTYSYYFVTTSLAFFALLFFRNISFFRMGKAVNSYLALNGRNPMVAYVASALIISPLFFFTSADELMVQLNTNAWAGFLKGVIVTALVSVITIFCTKKRWFWKT